MRLRTRAASTPTPRMTAAATRLGANTSTRSTMLPTGSVSPSMASTPRMAGRKSSSVSQKLASLTAVETLTSGSPPACSPSRRSTPPSSRARDTSPLRNLAATIAATSSSAAPAARDRNAKTSLRLSLRGSLTWSSASASSAATATSSMPIQNATAPAARSAPAAPWLPPSRSASAPSSRARRTPPRTRRDATCASTPADDDDRQCPRHPRQVRADRIPELLDHFFHGVFPFAGPPPGLSLRLLLVAAASWGR